MFNQSELMAAIGSSTGIGPSRLQVTCFTSEELEQMFRWDGEQYMEIHRASKDAFPDSLAFWIACIESLTWNADFGVKSGNGACILLDEDMLQNKVFLRFAALPMKYRPSGNVSAAMEMIFQWNRIAVIMNTDKEYYALFWMTYL